MPDAETYREAAEAIRRGDHLRMTKTEFMRQFPYGSPYTSELADYLYEHYVFGGYVEDKWSALNRALHSPMAADVNGVLRGTTVRDAFARAARLDDAVRREFFERLSPDPEPQRSIDELRRRGDLS